MRVKTKHEYVSQISMNLDETFDNNDKYDIIIKKINEVDPLRTTPLDALNILYDLKKEVDKK